MNAPFSMFKAVSAAVLAKAGAQGAERTAAPASPSPRAVTRGESGKAQQVVKLDWLNATFPAPSMSVDGFVCFIGKLMARPVSGTESRGLFGFESGVKLRAYVSGSMVEIGALAFGGESQRGRWMLQLTGKGCGLVADWSEMREFIEGLGARITRVDLAADFMAGEYTVDDAVRMHSEGGFTAGGRKPSTEVAGDWLEGIRGRTLYIGKGANGKMLRVYEKGIQLGDIGSPWVRYEIQLGNRDREIPFDVLTERDRFFAGAYPCLQQMVEDAAHRIPTTRAEAKVSMAHLLYHAKRAYGKLFHVLSGTTDFDVAELVRECTVIGVPRRLSPSGLAAGVPWADVQAQLQVRENA